MKTIRYEIDPYNRLVAGLPKFRKVLDGKFKVDENNSLSYHIKSPLSEDDNVPNQIKLSGTWELTDDHRLRLVLDRSARKTSVGQIDLKGEILDVNDNSLLFAITTITKDGTQSTYVLNIAGTWNADKNNRLFFRVRREHGRCDILTFTGTWEINDTHQIIYSYEQARLVKSKRKTHTLTFKGYWDIKEKARVSYVLSKDTGSVFDFKTSVGIFKEDYIQYEIGAGFAGRKKRPVQTIKLYGKWNFKKDIGLAFEIKYDNNRAKAIVFGTSLELSRKIFNGDGEIFLKALASARESAIYAGAGGRW